MSRHARMLGKMIERGMFKADMTALGFFLREGRKEVR